MKLNWKRKELKQRWTLSAEEWKLLKNKTGPTRLGFAVLMKYFHITGRFPDGPREVPRDGIRFVADQLELSIKEWREYPWSGRVTTYHRNEIREFFSFRKASLHDAKAIQRWLTADLLNNEHRPDRLQEAVLERYRHLHIEPPTMDQINRMIQSAIADHEMRFCNSIGGNFNARMTDRMNKLLQLQPSADGEWTAWQNIKSDPGKAGLESIKEAVARLNSVRDIGLPAELFKAVHPKLLERYAKRATVEEPFELRRHMAPLRLTLMATFLHRREEELTDHLVDLLVETVHKMGKKAEKRIDDSLGDALQKAPSKMAKLYRIAKASVEAPQGVVEEVICFSP
ncbi:DUF4158 domain-containing protein [Trichlorobacter lovleyi]|uniref:DUF4158 domain-containing protein n=1 Tax=Trichlorobacter lovleyi TaxID=313985 RepID=UPI003A0FD3E9